MRPSGASLPCPDHSSQERTSCLRSFRPPPSARLAPRAAAGLAGVALLTLTACGGGGEDPAAEESQTPEVPPAPEYTEIESDIWDTMLAAESVTLSVELSAALMNPQASSDAVVEQEYTGSLDGTASTFHELNDGVTTEMHMLEDAIYVPGELELESIARASGDAFSAEDFAAEFEGKWVDYSGQVDRSQASTAAFLEQMRSSMEDNGAASSLEGEAETREGEDVWVYTGGGVEAVVRAGDEPVLLSYAGESGDESVDLTFEDWDASEGPEEPAEEDVLSLDEVRAIVTG